MSIEDIRTLKHAKPFRPFVLVTKDGRKVKIEEAIRIALAPNGKSVAGFAGNGSFYLALSDIADVRQQIRRKKRAA